MLKSLWLKDLDHKKINPYGSFFLLLLCIEKIFLHNGNWFYFLSIRLNSLFFSFILYLKLLKLPIFIKYSAMLKVLRPEDLECKKKLPYGRFFSHTKSSGRNIFNIVLHLGSLVKRVILLL